MKSGHRAAHCSVSGDMAQFLPSTTALIRITQSEAGEVCFGFEWFNHLAEDHHRSVTVKKYGFMEAGYEDWIGVISV